MRTSLLLLLYAAANFAAGRDLLDLLPPETSYAMGVHVDRVSASPSWSFLLGLADPQRNYFRDTGLNLRRDLAEVIVTESESGRVVILRGTFDPDQASRLDRNYRERIAISYEGIRVYVPAEDGRALEEHADDPGFLWKRFCRTERRSGP